MNLAIEEQARRLASQNREADPDILEIYWFADDELVRLVETSTTIPVAGDDLVHPFYFRASEAVPAPSAIAMIRPEEVGKLRLPTGWGDWDSARRI